ncbi:MAG: type II toxin-antitoxin system HicB family antitoxin [Synergistaceae bacterium]|jgi:predicted RNase H-like HicB family nuclease|nr:type II toxin-antitoxin system HicB family antitoxin [Synergistaceae bacterium]
MTTQTTALTAVIYKDAGWFVAECPEIGTVSQGETLEKSVENLKEATELYLQETKLQPRGRAIITTFEAVVNA